MTQLPYKNTTTIILTGIRIICSCCRGCPNSWTCTNYFLHHDFFLHLQQITTVEDIQCSMEGTTENTSPASPQGQTKGLVSKLYWLFSVSSCKPLYIEPWAPDGECAIHLGWDGAGYYTKAKAVDALGCPVSCTRTLKTCRLAIKPPTFENDPLYLLSHSRPHLFSINRCALLKVS